MDMKKNGGAFHPFKRDKVVSTDPTSVPAAAASSTVDTVTNGCSSGNRKEEKEKEGQSQRKTRRCWSPELHRRFLHALQQLGGSHGMCNI